MQLTEIKDIDDLLEAFTERVKSGEIKIYLNQELPPGAENKKVTLLPFYDCDFGIPYLAFGTSELFVDFDW